MALAVKDSPGVERGNPRYRNLLLALEIIDYLLGGLLERCSASELIGFVDDSEDQEPGTHGELMGM